MFHIYVPTFGEIIVLYEEDQNKYDKIDIKEKNKGHVLEIGRAISWNCLTKIYYFLSMVNWKTDIEFHDSSLLPQHLLSLIYI